MSHKLGHILFFRQIQGLAWDPLGKYIASTSADASLRLFSQGKSKRSSYICQHLVTHWAVRDEAQDTEVRHKLFLGERVYTPFFRRMDWSPCGRILIVPSSQRAIPVQEKVSFEKNKHHSGCVYLYDI